MQLAAERIEKLMGDRILVKALKQPETTKGFYVPESYRKVGDSQRRSCWRGEVLDFGDKVDLQSLSAQGVKKGSVVIIAPEALDCPKFTSGDDMCVVVREEDLYGLESAEPV